MFLAYAAKADSPVAVAQWLLITVATALVSLALVLIPLALTVFRRPRQRSAVVLASLVWVAAVTASVGYFSMRQMDWNAAVQQRIEDGDFDPSDSVGKPNLPVMLWGGFALVYTLGTVWAASGRFDRSSPSTAGD